ncbi:MAG: tetratricopeptide repeat protein [Prochloraceae cyanobacterium]|nr:tetratricopeptide repeat protein [Prochloraceae cyanobacterium]
MGNRQRQQTIITLSGFSAFAFCLAGLAGWQWQQAEKQTKIANLEAKAIEAENLISTNSVEGLVMAMAAIGERSQYRLEKKLPRVYFSLSKTTEAVGERLRLTNHTGEVTSVLGSGNWQDLLTLACNRLRYHSVLLEAETQDAKTAGNACLEYSYWNNSKKAEFQRDRGLAISGQGKYSQGALELEEAKKRDFTIDLNPGTEKVERNPDEVAKQLAAAAIVQQASALAKDEKIDEAIVLFKKAQTFSSEIDLNPDTKKLEIDPNQVAKQLAALAMVRQAKQLNEKERIQEKIDVYNKAIEFHPNYTSAYYERGLVYSHQEKWELAIADYTKAIQIDSNFAGAYYERGLVYSHQEKWELAIADYTKAIQIRPDVSSAYYERGLVYSQQKKWELAIVDYTKAIQIRPDVSSAYYERGLVYSQQNQWELAIADYTKAIQIDSNFADAYYERGLVYSHQEKWELAIADYTKAIQIDSNFAGAYYERGLVYSRQNQWELAIIDYTKAIQIRPDLSSVYYELID